MSYHVFSPKPDLRHIVDFYWHVSAEQEVTGTQHFYTPVLQTLAFNFKQKTDSHIFNGKTHELLGPAYFFGQASSSRIIRSDGNGLDMIGVKFKPTGIARLTGISMLELADNIVSAEDIWPGEVGRLMDAMKTEVEMDAAIGLLEAFLLEKENRSRSFHHLESVAAAISLLTHSQGNSSVRALQLHTNTSRKTLERAFLHGLGLLPKQCAAIIRFNVARRLIEQEPQLQVTELALRTGYYDNSHLAAAFKRFCGMTVTAYLAQRRSGMETQVYFREHAAQKF